VGHRTVSLYGGSVFVERNNAFLTPKLGQERCMRFVRATRVSHGSYSKSSELYFLGSLVGHGTKFIPDKNCLEANMLRLCPNQSSFNLPLCLDTRFLHFTEILILLPHDKKSPTNPTRNYN
jgi:hypothetical protein